MANITNESDDIEIIEITNSKSKTSTTETLLDLYANWTRIIDPNRPILVNDHFYKDPIVKKMRPFAAYMYTLGLEVVLNQTLNSNDDASKSDDDDYNNNNDFNTNFLSNLDQYKELVKARNPPLKWHKCNFCDFKSDNLIALDHHLTQPHFYSTIYQCNFCSDFRSSSKEDYKAHLLIKHKRSCNFERPLSQYMCSNCNFECGNDYVKLDKHESLMCPFRPTETNPKPLENLLAPFRVSYLEYEYLFNEKPIETQDCNRFLIDSTSFGTCSANSSWLYESNQNLQMKIIESLINEDKYPSSIVSITKPSSFLTNGLNLEQLRNNLVISNTNNNNKPIEILKPPNKDLIISIQASNHYKCHLCSMKFIGEFRLKSLIDHLRLNHKIIDKTLTKTIQEYILPQIKSNKTQIQMAPTTTTKVVKLTPVTSANSNLLRILNSTKPTQAQTLSNYDIEKEQINQILIRNKKILSAVYSNLSVDLVNKLVELKMISGRCFKCGFKNTELNLVQHFTNVHNTDVKSLITDLNCFFCGQHFQNRDNLVVHQLNMHKSISFMSMNKIYTFSTSIETVLTEPKIITSNNINNVNVTSEISTKTVEVSKNNSILIDLTKDEIAKNCENIINTKIVKEKEKSPEPKQILETVKPVKSSPLPQTQPQLQEQPAQDSNKEIPIEKELKPVFDSTHDNLIQNLNDLYNKNSMNTCNDKNNMNKNNSVTKRPNLIASENDETHEKIKKKKLDYTCVKCSTQYNDFNQYKQHLLKDHHFLKEQQLPSPSSSQIIQKTNKSNDSLNIKISPSTSNTTSRQTSRSSSLNSESKILNLETKCFFCSFKFQSNSKYRIHLESNHIKKSIVKLNKINPNRLTFIKNNNGDVKNIKSPKLISTDQIRKSNRISIKKESSINDY